MVTFPCIYSASCLAWGISRISKGSASQLLSSSGWAGLGFSGGIPHWADGDTLLSSLLSPSFWLFLCVSYTHLPLVSFGSFQLLILSHVSPSPLDFVTSFLPWPCFAFVRFFMGKKTNKQTNRRGCIRNNKFPM